MMAKYQLVYLKIEISLQKLNSLIYKKQKDVKNSFQIILLGDSKLNNTHFRKFISFVFLKGIEKLVLFKEKQLILQLNYFLLEFQQRKNKQLIKKSVLVKLFNTIMNVYQITKKIFFKQFNQNLIISKKTFLHKKMKKKINNFNFQDQFKYITIILKNLKQCQISMNKNQNQYPVKIMQIETKMKIMRIMKLMKNYQDKKTKSQKIRSMQQKTISVNTYQNSLK
eukprot:TRINITY_DN14449_c0_g1_i2.p1 TRINITY_DN14449_c0_g1~~TRINITY_DN14449_c0_g1_i2.p1  ORF type:complete len:224 (-),score=21.39 TRINITY_DN14449_c0_g1_i2:439-1110(-)